ncbi:uracil-DNA glycosylase [Buchnera aphidicola (Taiwanaphis decaspermi)]|uniref:uracil-DNA glycosylase n=1 Tax=Buchnera aphidicola TaxID=9 RepID=UPI0031B89406
MYKKNVITWKKIFKNEKKILFKIIDKVRKERMHKVIYPSKCQIFNAFLYTPFNNIKVVIIGQDPYIHENQAHGLSFSVPYGTPIPQSLKNIYKEIKENISNFIIPKHGCLIKWAQRGVFLLNSSLTVEKNKKESHFRLGWEVFTDKIIEYISKYLKGIIFLLWGNFAKKKKKIIKSNKHYIFETSHPSPLSAYKGFFGCKHFSKANDILSQQGKKKINWQN